MSDFEPMTEKQLQEERAKAMPKDGWHPAHVSPKTIKKQSKSGVAMLVVELGVWDDDGNMHSATDYVGAFGEAGTPGRAMAMEKMFSLYKAAGKLEEYDRGQMLPESFWNCELEVRTRVKQDPEFGPKLEIKKYRPAQSQGAAAAKPAPQDAPAAKDDDDPIKF